MNRNGQTKVVDVIIFIVILGIVAAIIYAIYNINKPSITGNVVAEPKSSSQKNCRYVDVPVKKEEIIYEREPYTKDECNPVPIKYTNTFPLTLSEECIERNTCKSYKDVCVEKNFWGNCVEFEQVCNNYICSKKKVICETRIKNIDDEGGLFFYGLSFTEKFPTTEIKTEPETKSYYIRAEGESPFVWTYIKKDIDNIVSCKIEDYNIPTKTVCEKVIDYRSAPVKKEVINIEKQWKCD